LRSTAPMRGHFEVDGTHEGLDFSDGLGLLGRGIQVLEGSFSAKTSSGEGFSGSRCYQWLCFKTCSRWAVVQGRCLGACFPSSGSSGACK
jgi:hypothetical protein